MLAFMLCFIFRKFRILRLQILLKRVTTFSKIIPEKKLRKFCFLYLFIALIGMFFIGCSESPSTIGSDLLSADYINALQLSSDTVYQKSDVKLKAQKMVDGTRLFVGRLDNAEANSLVEFLITLPDSLKTGINNGTYYVKNAWVKLSNTYNVGKSSASINFHAYKINSNWTSSGFTSDSLAGLSYSTVVSSNLKINEGTSDSTTTFDLSTSLASEWISRAAGDSSKTNHGIILKPTSNSGKILGYQALASDLTYVPYLYIVLQKSGSYQDTLSFYPNQDVAAVKGEIPANNLNIYAEGSVELRSRIFFDVLGKIPAKSIINYAELTLKPDFSETQYSSTSSAAVYLFNSGDTTNYDSVSTNYVTMYLNDTVYVGNVTQLVQEWFTNGTNPGFILAPYLKYNGVDIFAFKGSSAPVAVRPKLTIKYTKKN